MLSQTTRVYLRKSYRPSSVKLKPVSYSGPTKHLNDPLDCEWLRETHLKHIKDLPAFGAFDLMGNEDAPEFVVLYAGMHPLVTDEPVAKFQQDKHGVLRLLSIR